MLYCKKRVLLMTRSRYGVECMGGFVQFEHVKKVYHMGDEKKEELKNLMANLMHREV